MDKINPCLFRPLDYPARSVVWEVTKRCNLKCPHCCNNAGPDYEDLSQVDADRLLTIIANNGVKEIYFSGGEPLLWKPLVQIISRANFLGIQCCIATSGFIDETKLLQELSKLNIFSIHVSLDSFCAENHDKFRGVKHAFEKTISFIKYAKDNNFFVLSSTLIRKVLLNDIDKMIEFLVSLGVDKATFNFLMPLGRGSDNNEDLFTTYQKISIYKKIQKIAHGNNLSIDCRRIKEAGNGFLDCPAGKTLIHIDYSGRVSPCSWVAKLWPDLTTTVSSSLLDDTLLTAFRERMLKITADACDNCLIQNDCGRGCPVIIQLLKQKYDLLCIYKKKNE